MVFLNFGDLGLGRLRVGGYGLLGARFLAVALSRLLRCVLRLAHVLGSRLRLLRFVLRAIGFFVNAGSRDEDGFPR